MLKSGFLHSSKRREQGQGLVEYALILVLVAVVVIVVLSLIGPAVGNIFSEVVAVMNGDMEQTQRCQIGTIEGWDTWDTRNEPWPGAYTAPWVMISEDQPTAPGHPSCTTFGGFQP